jgi:demethylmenaquinone methyltransferase/2-methoxy-6-polyprenyl-1,4-benzoquinol methylase
MIENTISNEQARCFYDDLGALHDFGERFERRAKQRGLDALELAPGMSVLNVGVGTGKEQRVIQEQILPGGVAAGIDLSRTMLDLSRQRVPAPGARALSEADGASLPFAAQSFDRVFSSYVLDLVPAGKLNHFLSEMRRVSRPDGRVVLVGLTEGTTLFSRLVMEAWKGFYRLSPYALGGCRPLQLTHSLLLAGFEHVRREVVVQLGVPSELLIAVP